ncbi:MULTISPECIES: deoxynucleotide monophosphate kinase [Pseudomonas]|uniref:Deoxynucleotide monophosphate kinase n=1 Tax=Pseudomonas fluorescens LMG 5329 TaxID=1324332 RepID=A0A0A1YVZ4_PSEFL|nr:MULTISPECIES: deoxynucleotide monophosphate kinase [Pseudomonas]KGE66195.1 deoxynucleotide monophosphate kinase [Pseudomonas fluorescens LMG 5329]NWE02574.1 deoxynucleotide monophosphate kinase [Pseudomonas sp. IPO3749]NWF22338.1 deoxynucleotide monophosphate kinase [Pseudomonas sp. IPO3749]
MRPILIGLTGRARSGKTTAAEHLARTYLLEQYAFADPLRDGLMAIFNLDPTDFEGDRKEQPLGWLDCSPRQLMQSMGTEWARNTVHPDVWVKLAEQNLEYMTKALGAVLGFVVSDVRFENEADLIRRRGGTVIHILRPNALTVNPHISEAGIAANSADLTLPNSGTVEGFLRSLDEVFLMIRERHQRAEQQSA